MGHVTQSGGRGAADAPEAPVASAPGWLVLHVCLVAAVALGSGVLQPPALRPEQATGVDLDRIAWGMAWDAFAAYGVLSTLGSIRSRRRLRSVLAVHAVSLPLAVPGGMLLGVLGFQRWLFGLF